MPGPPVTNASLFYGSEFQNTRSAIALAFLLSADVPGVKRLLSPAELKEAACCWAVLIAFEFVPQYAASQAAIDPTLGTLPNATLFNSAASNCCSSCSLA